MPNIAFGSQDAHRAAIGIDTPRFAVGLECDHEDAKGRHEGRKAREKRGDGELWPQLAVAAFVIVVASWSHFCRGNRVV